jgi:hypothetical protein
MLATPTALGRVIAAWPSCVLIAAYELLMRRGRHAAQFSHRCCDPPGQAPEGAVPAAGGELGTGQHRAAPGAGRGARYPGTGPAAARTLLCILLKTWAAADQQANDHEREESR